MPTLLTSDIIDFMESGEVSLYIAGCSAQLRPCATRAFGCRVARQSGVVTTWVSAAATSALLADISGNGRLALVVSHIETCRTFQLKAVDAAIAALEAADHECIAAYHDAFISQVEFVDSEHVALSFQFFNKTHQNVLDNAFASVCITDPLTGANHTLHLEYLRTEISGPVFSRMKARLAGVASHEGMTGIFKLQGSDIYRVLDVESAPGTYLAPPESKNFLTGLRAYAAHAAHCQDLDELIETTLADIESFFGIGHAMILVVDESADKLFTLASRGYESSGAAGDGHIAHTRDRSDSHDWNKSAKILGSMR